MRVVRAAASLDRLGSGKELALAPTIAFLCIAPTHAEVKLKRGSQNLTIHLGRWAVCPSALADGHEWQPVANALNYDDLFEKHVVEKRAT